MHACIPVGIDVPRSHTICMLIFMQYHVPGTWYDSFPSNRICTSRSLFTIYLFSALPLAPLLGVTDTWYMHSACSKNRLFSGNGLCHLVRSMILPYPQYDWRSCRTSSTILYYSSRCWYDGVKKMLAVTSNQPFTNII